MDYQCKGKCICVFPSPCTENSVSRYDSNNFTVVNRRRFMKRSLRESQISYRLSSAFPLHHSATLGQTHQQHPVMAEFWHHRARLAYSSSAAYWHPLKLRLVTAQLPTTSATFSSSITVRVSGCKHLGILPKQLRSIRCTRIVSFSGKHALYGT